VEVRKEVFSLIYITVEKVRGILYSPIFLQLDTELNVTSNLTEMAISVTVLVGKAHLK